MGSPATPGAAPASPGPAPASPGPAPAPPAAVARLAQRRGFGVPVLARKGDNPITNMVGALLLAAAFFGLAALINWSLRFIPVKPLAIVALLCVLAALFCVAFGFYLLFQGFRATYVYAGGVAWTHNARPHAAAWSEIDQLVVDRDGGKPKSAELVTFDGRQALIAAQPQDGADPFIDHLEQAVRALGRPVPPRAAQPQRGLGAATNSTSTTVRSLPA